MTPENEQGVVVLFSQQAQAAGFEIVSISTAFPDALVSKAGVTYRAEFEYQAANFKEHRHDLRKCDLVIAWTNDWPDCILPVLALSEPSWADTDLTLPGELERKAAYWEQRALSAERRVQEAERRLKSLKKTNSGEPLLIGPRKNPLGRAGEVLEVYEEHPEWTISQVAEHFGVSPQAVSQHVSKLIDAGMVKRNGNGLEVVGK